MFNIAIDGPAGAGKSTIAKLVAKKLNFIYVDTGALYRGLAYACLGEGLNKEDKEEVVSVCRRSRIELAFDTDGTQIVLLNGRNVNPYIRTEQVSAMTSGISVYPEVREVLLSIQRDIAHENCVVMDGRDIGTNILPQADVKIFLTASVDERARRRFLEQKEKDPSVTFAQIRQDILERDDRDEHRKTAPLRRAQDAVVVDSTGLTIEQVAEQILTAAVEKGAVYPN